MNISDVLISQIETKISEMHHDKTIASGLLDNPKEPDTIDGYIRLQKDSLISDGVRYIALDNIAQEYQLYNNMTEKQRITDIIGQALSEHSFQWTFDSLHLLKNNHTVIYKANPLSFDRVEKLVRSKLGLPLLVAIPPTIESVPNKISNHKPEAFSPPLIQNTEKPLTNAASQNKMILAAIIGAFFGGGLIVFGLSLGQNTNNILTDKTSSNPSPRQGSAPIRISPDVSIRNHYKLLQDRQLEKSWTNLSTSFQGSNLTKGFQEYSQWWNSVDKIEIGSIEILGKSLDSAVVKADLSYTLRGGRVISDQKKYFYMVWDNDKWLINGKSDRQMNLSGR
jgi:hypothetical protein